MRILLVHNWPGQKNSELDLIHRIIRVSHSLDHQCTVIDPFGHPLDRQGRHIEDCVAANPREYDFCLNLHYLNPNLLDTFSYAVNWNPLNYVVRNPLTGDDLLEGDIAFRTACMESHHVLLSAGSEEMDDFVNALNSMTRHHMNGHRLQLHTSSDISSQFAFPDFKQFKIFYIGANWEKLSGVARHGSLIELLDKTGLVDFYGVRELLGVYVWEGIKNYRGELPFDGGASILRKSNECGVSLVLHSAAHRSSGLASTRIFQACAAKTLTICDDNPFVLEAFGDSVLTFKFCNDAARNLQNILNKVEWVRENPRLALEKATAAHEVFRQKFSFEHQIGDLCSGHQANVEEYLRQLGARDPSAARVDVVYIHQQEHENYLTRFLDDLSSQLRAKPKALIYTRDPFASSIARIAKGRGVEFELVSMPKESDPYEGWVMADAIRHRIVAPYFALYGANTSWQRFHLTHLVRALEENHTSISHSGTYIRNLVREEKLEDYYLVLSEKIGNYPKPITIVELAGFAADRFTQSSMLFKTEAFKDPSVPCCLRFFDKGWAIFLSTFYYLNAKELPILVPKLTDAYCVYDEPDQTKNSFHGAHQKLSFERSLMHAFFKYLPEYELAFRQLYFSGAFPGLSDAGGFKGYSINEYMEAVLQHRPRLLGIYRSLFRLACKALGLNHIIQSSMTDTKKATKAKSMDL